MNRWMSFAFLFFSILFIVLVSVPDLNVHWIVKILPISILGVSVLRDHNFKYRLPLSGALFASATGDTLLHLDLFVPGLSAFLIAQIQYAVIFYKFRNHHSHRHGLQLFLAIYLVAMLIVLLPNLGEMMIPVIGYLIVIALMGFLAVRSSLSLKWAVLGALVFILSDSLIAVNKFLVDLPFERILVMSSYYIAQWMLVTGFLESSINSHE